MYTQLKLHNVNESGKQYIHHSLFIFTREQLWPKHSIVSVTYAIVCVAFSKIERLYFFSFEHKTSWELRHGLNQL